MKTLLIIAQVNDGIGLIVAYLLGGALAIFLIIIIIRALFSIPTMVFNLKEQTRLLNQIALNTQNNKPTKQNNISKHDSDLEKEALSYPKPKY